MAFLRHSLFALRTAAGRAPSDPLPLAVRHERVPRQPAERRAPPLNAMRTAAHTTTALYRP